ncbi:DHHC zinc finger domain containing protein [Tritrichomonas foetus]|uniref:Palmitoyltransferase n=1 Tax=Tritrichomonas foetus TaxID=1144522 RepID=A0A1J4JVD6_9EUKA|nr:DHHC zinc finger domain containing protein [Tritrichomonas foetus]|eukprot:OHT01229.1 DHHC zinc finger domain containing protein [Tritrichomonas foetus]
MNFLITIDLDLVRSNIGQYLISCWFRFILSSFQIVHFLVYLYHIAGFLVCLYSDTKFHQKLFNKDQTDFSVLLFPILIILACYFYYLTSKGPGFVEIDELPFCQKDYSWHCNICNLTPPLRSTHCKKCQRCVLRRDHHCPWLGVCVGMENHFFFIVFLLFDSIVFFKFMIESFPVTQKSDTDFIEWIFTSFLCAIVCAVGAFGFIQTSILFPFHVFLAITNKTTWESLKSDTITYMKGWYSSLSPFSRGMKMNIYEFVTMRWNHPIYELPQGSRLEQWKMENSFLVNDSYECC